MSAALYGVVAEFETPERLLEAANAARLRGYKAMDAYAPWPVEGLSEAIGFRRNRVALCCLLGGMTGGIGGYFMQWYAMAIDYPINIGGRPFNSIPSFIPITFELTILCAAISTILGMLALNGLPRPHHPIFNAPDFERATTDRFFLCIEARDPRFDAREVADFLRSHEALAVSEVLDE